ncbi:hypothetical protein ACHAWF_003424 [Thalassiosira exigua]
MKRLQSADVVFEVVARPHSDNTPDNKPKLSPEKFFAHRLILQQCAPLLADMSAKGGSISIPDVDPEIFRLALRYAYGGKLSDEDMAAHVKDIIDSADRFGIVNLKLEAEAFYVQSTTITLENMTDNLLYADAKNCALLKEAVIDFAVEHGSDVVEKVSLKDFPEGMVGDVLTAVTRNKERGGKTGKKAVKLNTMRVSELRTILDGIGLEVDGSRESMIKTIRESLARDAEIAEQDHN